MSGERYVVRAKSGGVYYAPGCPGCRTNKQRYARRYDCKLDAARAERSLDRMTSIDWCVVRLIPKCKPKAPPFPEVMFVAGGPNFAQAYAFESRFLADKYIERYGRDGERVVRYVLAEGE